MFLEGTSQTNGTETLVMQLKNSRLILATMAVSAGIGLLVGAATAYHGYKRTGRITGAVGYGTLGYMFPWVTGPVALIQGSVRRRNDDNPTHHTAAPGTEAKGRST